MTQIPLNADSPAAAEATIHDLSTDGRGVTRIDERVYFVERALPGDRVRVQLDPAATVLELLEPSPDRLPHPCPHAAECPGSLWGSLAYGQQLHFKHSLINRTLRKAIGEVPVLSVAPSPLPWGYRNRLSLTVWVEDNHARVGFQTGARQSIGVGIHTCKLGAPDVEAALEALSAALLNVETGALPPLPVRLQLHTTAHGAGALLIFADLVRERDLKAWDLFFAALPLPGGAWYAQGTHAGVIDFRQPIVAGEAAMPMVTKTLGQTLALHPAAFSQANASAAMLVEKRLQRLARESKFEAIWDLYGGFGALGMAAARSAQPVHVFEISPFAEAAMHDLAAATGHTQTQFRRGDLLSLLPRASRAIGPRDLIILDPPRSGAHPNVLDAILASKAHHLAYLSCNPARLGRDLARLQTGGFRPREFQPYDFFPQTPSLEVLALLTRD